MLWAGRTRVLYIDPTMVPKAGNLQLVQAGLLTKAE
jgi:hypothetical protein